MSSDRSKRDKYTFEICPSTSFAANYGDSQILNLDHDSNPISNFEFRSNVSQNYPLTRCQRSFTEPLLYSQDQKYNSKLGKSKNFYYPERFDPDLLFESETEHDLCRNENSNDLSDQKKDTRKKRLCDNCGNELRPKRYLEQLREDMEAIDNLTKIVSPHFHRYIWLNLFCWSLL